MRRNEKRMNLHFGKFVENGKAMQSGGNNRVERERKDWITL